MDQDYQREIDDTVNLANVNPARKFHIIGKKYFFCSFLDADFFTINFTYDTKPDDDLMEAVNIRNNSPRLRQEDLASSWRDIQRGIKEAKNILLSFTFHDNEFMKCVNSCSEINPPNHPNPLKPGDIFCDIRNPKVQAVLFEIPKSDMKELLDHMIHEIQNQSEMENTAIPPECSFHPNVLCSDYELFHDPEKQCPRNIISSVLSMETSLMENERQNVSESMHNREEMRYYDDNDVDMSLETDENEADMSLHAEENLSYKESDGDETTSTGIYVSDMAIQVDPEELSRSTCKNSYLVARDRMNSSWEKVAPVIFRWLHKLCSHFFDEKGKIQNESFYMAIGALKCFELTIMKKRTLEEEEIHMSDLEVFRNEGPKELFSKWLCDSLDTCLSLDGGRYAMHTDNFVQTFEAYLPFPYEDIDINAYIVYLRTKQQTPSLTRPFSAEYYPKSTSPLFNSNNKESSSVSKEFPSKKKFVSLAIAASTHDSNTSNAQNATDCPVLCENQTIQNSLKHPQTGGILPIGLNSKVESVKYPTTEILSLTNQRASSCSSMEYLNRESISVVSDIGSDGEQFRIDHSAQCEERTIQEQEERPRREGSSVIVRNIPNSFHNKSVSENSQVLPSNDPNVLMSEEYSKNVASNCTCAGCTNMKSAEDDEREEERVLPSSDLTVNTLGDSTQRERTFNISLRGNMTSTEKTSIEEERVLPHIQHIFNMPGDSTQRERGFIVLPKGNMTSEENTAREEVRDFPPIHHIFNMSGNSTQRERAFIVLPRGNMTSAEYAAREEGRDLPPIHHINMSGDSTQRDRAFLLVPRGFYTGTQGVRLENISQTVLRLANCEESLYSYAWIRCPKDNELISVLFEIPSNPGSRRKPSVFLLDNRNERAFKIACRYMKSETVRITEYKTTKWLHALVDHCFTSNGLVAIPKLRILVSAVLRLPDIPNFDKTSYRYVMDFVNNSTDKSSCAALIYLWLMYVSDKCRQYSSIEILVNLVEETRSFPCGIMRNTNEDDILNAPDSTT